jgi:hypothetical protein
MKNPQTSASTEEVWLYNTVVRNGKMGILDRIGQFGKTKWQSDLNIWFHPKSGDERRGADDKTTIPGGVGIGGSGIGSG